MKLFIDYNIKKKPSTGKGIFISRLIPELVKLNVEITDDPNDKHDISLHIARIKNDTGSKKVMRLNGVNFDTSRDYKCLNDPIKRDMYKCDGVIYQSNFSEDMCFRFLGHFKGHEKVIYNASSVNNDIEPFKSKFKYNFMASARWRRHKRLKETIETFIKADIPDSKLWVAGKPDYIGYMGHDHNIEFLGQVDCDELIQYYKMADVLIHLCPFDSCPNSVIEALLYGCKILCSNTGGTKELLIPTNDPSNLYDHVNGIVSDIDNWSHQITDVGNPSKVDIDFLANDLKNILNILNWWGTKTEYHMEEAAFQYKNFMEKVLNG